MPRCFFFVACTALLLSMVAAILERGCSFFFFLWCLMVVGNQKGALPPPGVSQGQILDLLCLKRIDKREEKRKKERETKQNTPSPQNKPNYIPSIFRVLRAYISKAFTHSSDVSCKRSCKLLIFLKFITRSSHSFPHFWHCINTCFNDSCCHKKHTFQLDASLLRIVCYLILCVRATI